MVVVRSMHHRESMAGGIEACKLRQQRADAVDGVDDVGARLAEDDDAGRRACRWPGRRCECLQRESVTVGDIATGGRALPPLR